MTDKLTNEEVAWLKRFEELLFLRAPSGEPLPVRYTSRLGKDTWRCPSTTQAGVWYDVTLADGELTCTCPAWTYRHYCKHVLFPEYIARTFHPRQRMPNYYEGYSEVLYTMYGGVNITLTEQDMKVHATLNGYPTQVIARHELPLWMVKAIVGGRYSAYPTWNLFPQTRIITLTEE